MGKRQFHTPEAYQKYVQKQLDLLTPVFAKAAVGDFSSVVRVPERENEFTELFTGTEILLEVVRKRIAEVEEEKATDEAVLSSIGDGMIVTDLAGNILLANQKALDLLGWKRQPVARESFSAAVPIIDEKGRPIPQKQTPVTVALTSKKVFTLNAYLKRKNASQVPVAITATPVTLNKKVIGAVILLRDVTKEREIDRAKTEIISFASHQLRTPLSIVIWYAAELLDSESVEIPEKQRRYLERIFIASKRMVALVDMFLNVSRIELGTLVIKPEYINLAALADNAIRELGLQIKKKNITVLTQYKNARSVYADDQAMRIAFQNIFSNAVHYTSPGGKIKIKLQKQRRYFLVSVSDNGYGIPKNQQEKIFEKFFRARNVVKKETEGTGLGLYIVQSMMQKAGGRVWFTSKENKGTTFYISIPFIKKTKSTV